MCIKQDYSILPISRQCELLGLSRGAYYYNPRGESPLNFELMNRIDKQYTRTPFYGVPKMTAWLRREGYSVNPKRVRRLMRRMGLEAVYPKPLLSKPDSSHKIYPYLLSGMEIRCPDHVWSTDITYIRLLHGFVYLVAVMDWYSRYVLSWAISTTLEKEFCIQVLKHALRRSKPEIFNSDQGSQFTSPAFTGHLETSGIRISMDGRGRALDNIFVERLWRSVKYEEVYLNDYKTVSEARSGLDRYFRFYNAERLHQSLEYRTPSEIYFQKKSDFNPMQAQTIHLKQTHSLS